MTAEDITASLGEVRVFPSERTDRSERVAKRRDGTADTNIVIAHYCWVEGCGRRHNRVKDPAVVSDAEGESRILPLCQRHYALLEELAPADDPYWL